MSGTDLETKRVEVLKETVPTTTRIMVLHYPSIGQVGVVEVQAAAHALQIEAIIVQTADPGEFDRAFARAKEQHVDALVTMASPFLSFNRKQLIGLAARYRFPSIREGVIYVREGGLQSYGPSFPDMYRRSAGYIAKFIKRANAAALPVEDSIKFELAINLKTADALDISVPPTLLGRADEVVE